MYKYDADALEWIRWDGEIKLAIDGPLYLAVDELEDNTAWLAYSFIGVLEDGGNTYLGYEAANGKYRITRVDSSNNFQYAAGTGGIPDKSTPANWTATILRQPEREYSKWTCSLVKTSLPGPFGAFLMDTDDIDCGCQPQHSSGPPGRRR
jgi:hypothetical protein